MKASTLITILQNAQALAQNPDVDVRAWVISDDIDKSSWSLRIAEGKEGDGDLDLTREPLDHHMNLAKSFLEIPLVID